MEGLFGLFLLLVFILAPLLEQIRKGQSKQPPPPPRRPPMRLPQEPRRSETEEVSGKSRESASVLVPDDLWQILTGEQRPPVSTPPEPVAETRRRQPWDVVYIPPEEEADDEEEGLLEDVDVEVARTSREEIRRDVQRGRMRGAPVSLEEAPVVVSLETPLPTPSARHAAFHEKIARLTAESVVAAKPRQRPLFTGSRSELQRAVILKEVLGRPRGLE